MLTNQAPLANAIGKHANDYLEGIDVPDFDQRAVQARDVAPIRSTPWRKGAMAAAAVVIVAAFILNAPAVLAQVERTLRAFVVTGGRTEAVPVTSLTLDQARARVPFTVIAPAGIPAGYQGTIDEIDPGPSRFESRLIFRFSNGAAPGFTIMETSATSTGQKQHLWMTVGKGIGVPPPPSAFLPRASTGQQAFVQFNSRGVIRRIAAEPVSWTVSGTRIQLISPPWVLSKAQLEAIRRAMF